MQIRAQIRRDGATFVPAVLRNPLTPTKILIETANLANAVDCTRLEDPEWRHWFAEAYDNALKTHFAGSAPEANLATPRQDQRVDHVPVLLEMGAAPAPVAESAGRQGDWGPSRM